MKTVAIIILLVGVLMVLFRRMSRVYSKMRSKDTHRFNEMEEYMLITGVVFVLLGGILCFVF